MVTSEFNANNLLVSGIQNITSVGKVRNGKPVITASIGHWVQKLQKRTACHEGMIKIYILLPNTKKKTTHKS